MQSIRVRMTVVLGCLLLTGFIMFAPSRALSGVIIGYYSCPSVYMYYTASGGTSCEPWAITDLAYLEAGAEASAEGCVGDAELASGGGPGVYPDGEIAVAAGADAYHDPSGAYTMSTGRESEGGSYDLVEMGGTNGCVQSDAY